MKAKPNVGVVGVGAMGMNVAKRLLDRGFPVSVRDIRPEAEDEARAAGAKICESPAMLARDCDVVITLVVDAEQTEEVVFGPDSLMNALTREAVLIMSSTVQPAFAAGLAQRLAERGVPMLDAPVSGGPARARDGTMSMMLAGADAVLERVTPVLESMAGARVRVSERPGDGSKAKIVNNMLAGVNLAAACEAMTLGIKLGLDPSTIFDVVNTSSGASWVFADRMPRVLTADYAPRAAVDLLRKDLAILLETAQSVHFPALVARTAHAVFEDAARLGHGREDDAALVKVYQTLSGIRLPGDE